MDITSITVIIIGILIVLTIYLMFQLIIKKKKGSTLNKTNEILKKSIGKKELQESELTQNLENLKSELNRLLELEKSEQTLKKNVVSSKIELAAITEEVKNLTNEKNELLDRIISIKEDISIYQPVEGLMNVGFFEEPEYLFETGERYKEEIKIIRELQKKMIIEHKAIILPDTIAISDDKVLVKKILVGQEKLMLKAFNIECDNLMQIVKPSNYAKILERIDKVATDLEKSVVSMKCGFNRDYVELKFKECEVQYQFKLKDEREKEEQAAIKEQMREEQKAIREFERALAKAQREEKMYKEALEEARKEFELAGNKDRKKMEAKIEFLEEQLREAEENEKRAKSMAEQTRRGYVYIISNIGSFGDDIYKIGLTRRLEPMDRVKELSDASVPFSFDVHAMIYSEDAPALETQLHKEFTHYRVNQVNHRKEFFNVSLLDIMEKTKEILGEKINFKITALAKDYYESQKLRYQ